MDISDILLIGSGIVLIIYVVLAAINVRIEERELERELQMKDTPKHYMQGPYECIKVWSEIRKPKSLDGLEAVYDFNVFKYIWRWRDKGGLADLYKAKDYLDRLIDYKEESYQS